MNRLQTRLIVSFMVVLLITLSIIGVALMLFLRSRPVPIEDIVSDLAFTSLETDFRSLISDLRPGQNNERIRLVSSYLNDLSQTTDHRLILVSGGWEVLYDSMNQAPAGTQLNIVNQQPLRPGVVIDRGTAAFSYGTFRDASNQEWVFVNRPIIAPLNPPRRGEGAGQGQGNGGLDYVVAAPRPQQTLPRVIDSFGETFFLPLCQAGFIGMIIALLLSLWLSRSVARPLQNIADAAGRVAAGHYDQQVPVDGPTEARMVARAFNDMTQQVEQTRQAQQDFLANVTHDLRTPLTSIQGFSQAIMDGVAAEPEAAQHSAHIIHEEASRLTRLVADLLDIARIQAGRMQMMRHAVELDQILRTVGESMSVKAQQSSIHLHVQIAPLVRIAGDGDRLAQVFTNLVDNAIKHTDPGGQVWLIAKMEQSGILIQVQDTGEGIPQEDLPRIFERFYQVDKSRKREEQHNGAGLGLAITYEIIKAHGGTIRVESQPGVGTRFSVWLPLISPEQSTMIAQHKLR